MGKELISFKDITSPSGFKRLTHAQWLQIKCRLQQHIDLQLNIDSNFSVVNQDSSIGYATAKDGQAIPVGYPIFGNQNVDLIHNQTSHILFDRKTTTETKLHSELNPEEQFQVEIANTMLRLLDMTRELDYLVSQEYTREQNPDLYEALRNAQTQLLNFPESGKNCDPAHYHTTIKYFENQVLVALVKTIKCFPELDQGLSTVSDYQATLEILRMEAAGLDPATITQTTNMRQVKNKNSQDIALTRTEIDIPITIKTTAQIAALETLYAVKLVESSIAINQPLVTKTRKLSSREYILSKSQPLQKYNNRCEGDQSRKITPVGNKNGKLNVLKIQANGKSDISFQFRCGSIVGVDPNLSEAERTKHAKDNIEQLIIYKNKIDPSKKLHFTQLISNTVHNGNREGTTVDSTWNAVNEVNSTPLPSNYILNRLVRLYRYFFGAGNTDRQVYYTNIAVNGYGTVMLYSYDPAIKHTFTLWDQFKTFLQKYRYELASKIHEALDNAIDIVTCMSGRDRTGGQVLHNNIKHEEKILNEWEIQGETYECICVSHARNASPTGTQNNPGSLAIKEESCPSGLFPDSINENNYLPYANTNKAPKNIHDTDVRTADSRHHVYQSTHFSHAEIAQNIFKGNDAEIKNIPTIADLLVVYQLLGKYKFFSSTTDASRQATVLHALQSQALGILLFKEDATSINTPSTTIAINIKKLQELIRDSDAYKLFAHSTTKPAMFSSDPAHLSAAITADNTQYVEKQLRVMMPLTMGSDG